MSDTVVVIGGGIGGLEAALRTERKSFEVKLVDPKDSMLFYPSAHKVLEGESADKHSIKFNEKFHGRNIEHLKQKAEKIYLEDEKIILEDGEVSYDYLVIAVGSETEFHGVNGSEKAHTMKFKEETSEIYEKLSNGGADSLVIVGGGSTGVEAAASLLEMRKDEGFDISLVHSSETLLPGNGSKLSLDIQSSLEEHNVNLVLGRKAVEIKDSEIVLDNEDKVEADIVLWAGGVSPSSFINDLDIESDKGGLKVDPNMETSKENVFAVGDVASYPDKNNRALYAIFEAKTVAKNVKRRSENKDLASLDIKWDPEIIYLGKRDSALEFGDFCFRGIIPSIIRSLGVEMRYMLMRKYLL